MPKVAKKKAPAKKAVAKKAAPKRAAKKVAAKTPAKKAASKPKKNKSGGPGRSLPRDFNEHGFVVGSDSQKIFDVLLEGGESRTDMNAKALKAIGRTTTPDGNKINMSSAIATLIKQAEAKGYTVESNWVLNPPTAASKAAATRKKNKGAVKKAAPKKRAVKKAVKSKK